MKLQIIKIINGMARFTVVFYSASILKSSPKGEGVSPNPRRDNKYYNDSKDYLVCRLGNKLNKSEGTDIM